MESGAREMVRPPTEPTWTTSSADLEVSSLARTRMRAVPFFMGMTRAWAEPGPLGRSREATEASSTNHSKSCSANLGEMEAVTLTAGSFYWNPKGNVHGPTLAHEETVVLEVYDGPHYPVKPDWYTDERDAR